MDHNRFDSVARVFSATVSRRAAGGLLAVGLALAALGDAAGKK